MTQAYLLTWLESKQKEVYREIETCQVEDLISLQAKLKAISLLLRDMDRDIKNGKLALEDLELENN